MKQLIREHLYNVQQLKTLEAGLNKLYVGKNTVSPSTDEIYKITSLRAFNGVKGPKILFFYGGTEEETVDFRIKDIKKMVSSAVKAYTIRFYKDTFVDHITEQYEVCDVLRDPYIGMKVKVIDRLKPEADNESAYEIQDFIVDSYLTVVGLMKPLGYADPSLPGDQEVKEEICEKYGIENYEIHFERSE